MAILAVQKITLTGLEPTYVAAGSSGDRFSNDGNTFFHVKNAGTSSVTVTFDSIRPCDQGFDHDATVTVPASSEKMAGPFPRRFSDDDGMVNVTYSSSADVTVAAIQL